MAQFQDHDIQDSRDAGGDDLQAFFRTYVRMAEDILEAIEKDQWQRAWLLVRERDRFCRLHRVPVGKASQERFSSQGRVPRTDASSLQGTLNHVLELDRRSVRLLEEKIGEIQTELRDLQMLRRWSRSRLSPIPSKARLLDADG